MSHSSSPEKNIFYSLPDCIALNEWDWQVLSYYNSFKMFFLNDFNFNSGWDECDTRKKFKLLSQIFLDDFFLFLPNNEWRLIVYGDVEGWYSSFWGNNFILRRKSSMSLSGEISYIDGGFPIYLSEEEAQWFWELAGTLRRIFGGFWVIESFYSWVMKNWLFKSEMWGNKLICYILSQTHSW